MKYNIICTLKQCKETSYGAHKSLSDSIKIIIIIIIIIIESILILINSLGLENELFLGK